MAQRKKGSLGFGVFRMYSERERDQYIGAMVEEWKEQQEGKISVGKPFITVSRQFGCMALETGLRFAERLNQVDASDSAWTFYDKEIVHRIASDMRISKRLASLLTEGSRSKIARYMDGLFEKWPVEDEVFERMVRVIRSICEKGHAVVVGRGAYKIAQDLAMELDVVESEGDDYDQAALAVLSRVIAAQSLQVDAVSEATRLSKLYRLRLGCPSTPNPAAGARR